MTDEDFGKTFGDTPGRSSDVNNGTGVTDMHRGTASIPGKPFGEDMVGGVELH